MIEKLKHVVIPLLIITCFQLTAQNQEIKKGTITVRKNNLLVYVVPATMIEAGLQPLANDNSSEILYYNLQKADFLYTHLNTDSFQTSGQVISFELVIKREKRVIEKRFVTGPKFNPDLKMLFEKVNSGDNISFNKIKVKDINGYEYPLTSLSYIVFERGVDTLEDMRTIKERKRQKGK